jgi:hypothetical protein
LLFFRCVGVVTAARLCLDLLLRFEPLRVMLVSRLAIVFVQCGFIRPQISGRSRSKGSESRDCRSSRYEGYADVTGLVGPGEELRTGESLRKENCDMRASSLKGDSSDDLEDRTELPSILDDCTVDSRHCFIGSASAFAPSSSSSCSMSGDLAETKPESTLDLLGWCSSGLPIDATV